jgi:hypothetical protein
MLDVSKRTSNLSDMLIIRESLSEGESHFRATEIKVHSLNKKIFFSIYTVNGLLANGTDVNYDDFSIYSIILTYRLL